MSYTMIGLDLDLFEQLLAHAPNALAQQAKDDAQRAILALCFTEADILQQCEKHKQWAKLPPQARADTIASLLEMGEYEHATVVANEAIAEAVMRYFDDLDDGG